MSSKPKASEPVAPMVFMKGGTLSGQFQKEMAQREENSNKRRAHQDSQYAMSQQGVGADGSVARLGSSRMVTQDAPHLILHYRDYNQDCVSEVTMVPKPGAPSEMEMMFTLVCYGCLKRGIRMDEAQLMVRQSHRNFWIDDRPKNRMPQRVELIGMVSPAGKVTAADTIRCTNYGCDWAVKVIDSQVEEV